jgi:hypothetical protein
MSAMPKFAGVPGHTSQTFVAIAMKPGIGDPRSNLSSTASMTQLSNPTSRQNAWIELTVCA